MFTIPPRDVPEGQHSDGAAESPSRDDEENDDWPQVDAGETEDLEVSRNPDTSMAETTLYDGDTAIAAHKVARKKRVKVSKHGIQYPSLPLGVVKKLATTYARTSGNSKSKISKDTLDAIMQASDWFFEQVSDDLAAYAQHAGRKTIEESDVVTLMRRYVTPPYL
jgi:histone H3/H4